MVRTFLTKTFSTLTEAFQNCLKRFPITVCFAIALTGYLIYWVTIEKEERLFFIIAYYLSIGTLLSLTLHLWCEEIKKPSARIITQAVAHVLLIADSVFLYYLSPEESLTEITIAHGAGIFALGISIFFLSFTKEKKRHSQLELHPVEPHILRNSLCDRQHHERRNQLAGLFSPSTIRLEHRLEMVYLHYRGM